MGSERDPAPSGPLAGVRILEIGGIGPTPFAGMLLADMGADVLRLGRIADGDVVEQRFDVTLRGRATVRVDLKEASSRALVRQLSERADGLIEGFRPGVMERLGLGPEDLMASNPRMVYGRMTGYGQDGPLASVAGHDINYISVAGVLGACARAGDTPMFPLNLVGDYGGGGMLLAFGMVCGVLEARASGHGQVIDAAMVDGAALLTSLQHGMRAAGVWDDRAGSNLLDSGAHFYEVYKTSDGGHVAVGAIEAKFYARLLTILGIESSAAPQWDRAQWPRHKKRFSEVFATRTRAEWAELLEQEEACATAVLGLGEAPAHPHLQARSTFVEVDGVVQPAAAPRFSRTPGRARPAIADTSAALVAWGVGHQSASAAAREDATAC
jgi:alpha-methylacyl-CoA racemase